MNTMNEGRQEIKSQRSEFSELMRLHFNRYVLDLTRGCLLLDSDEITLRPKTFAVLQFLAENAGRLVSKDELFTAVWPDVAVTDDALVQSIGELRRALGEDGPRLIKTVPRRGYRFKSSVSVDPPHGAPRPAVSPSDDIHSPRLGGFQVAKGATLYNWRGRSLLVLAVVGLLAAGRTVDRPRLGVAPESRRGRQGGCSQSRYRDSSLSERER